MEYGNQVTGQHGTTIIFKGCFRLALFYCHQISQLVWSKLAFLIVFNSYYKNSISLYDF